MPSARPSLLVNELLLALPHSSNCTDFPFLFPPDALFLAQRYSPEQERLLTLLWLFNPQTYQPQQVIPRLVVRAFRSSGLLMSEVAQFLHVKKKSIQKNDCCGRATSARSHLDLRRIPPPYRSSLTSCTFRATVHQHDYHIVETYATNGDFRPEAL